MATVEVADTMIITTTGVATGVATGVDMEEEEEEAEEVVVKTILDITGDAEIQTMRESSFGNPRLVCSCRLFVSGLRALTWFHFIYNLVIILSVSAWCP